MLQRAGKPASGWLLNRSYRYVEGILEEDEDVAVLGHGVHSYDENAPGTSHQGGFRQPALGQRLNIHGARSLPFYISDDLSTVV